MTNVKDVERKKVEMRTLSFNKSSAALLAEDVTSVAVSKPAKMAGFSSPKL